MILVSPALWGWSNLDVIKRSALWIMMQIAPGSRLTGSGLNIRPSDNENMLIALGRDPYVIKATRIDGTPPSATADPSGDQKADNGKVTLKIVGANGREENSSVEIIRPAIPASVVALMARRESSGQGGDLIVDQIAGGLTLMSSISPSGVKGHGKIAPTQAPYFRLLVKGERLTPKPGRADDTSWPLTGSTSEAPPQPVSPAAPSAPPKG